MAADVLKTELDIDTETRLRLVMRDQFQFLRYSGVRRLLAELDSFVSGDQCAHRAAHLINHPPAEVRQLFNVAATAAMFAASPDAAAEAVGHAPAFDRFRQDSLREHGSYGHQPYLVIAMVAAEEAWNARYAVN